MYPLDYCKGDKKEVGTSAPEEVSSPAPHPPSTHQVKSCNGHQKRGWGNLDDRRLHNILRTERQKHYSLGEIGTLLFRNR